MKVMTIILYLFNCPYLYLLLAIIILMLCKASRSYINMTDILLSYNEKILKAHKLKLLFIVFPILLSMSINMVKLIDKDIIDSITLSVSILISMFFAYIAFFDEYKISNIDDASIKKILEKTNFESNIIVSYEILISIMLLIICMVYPIISVNDRRRTLISGQNKMHLRIQMNNYGYFCT